MFYFRIFQVSQFLDFFLIFAVPDHFLYCILLADSEYFFHPPSRLRSLNQQPILSALPYHKHFTLLQQKNKNMTYIVGNHFNDTLNAGKSLTLCFQLQAFINTKLSHIWKLVNCISLINKQQTLSKYLLHFTIDS